VCPRHVTTETNPSCKDLAKCIEKLL
jgi:hypothetical protein